MNKIVVKHSRIEINDYNLGDCPRLEYNFTIVDRFSHTVYIKGMEYIEDTKTLILPRGIDIFYLESMFNVVAYVDSACDKYDYLEDIRINYLPRDDIQREALQFMLGEGKYKHNKSKSQLSLNLNTGKGKSYCSITMSAYLQIRSIIITSSLNWLNQWKDYILEYTDTQPNEIYFISGSSSIDRLLNKKMKQYKFILASHNTIKSYGDKNGWYKITQLFKYMKVGLKFYDEAHLNFDNMMKIDFYTNTYKTIYVTASPARSAEEENQIYKLYFRNVPSIDLFDPNDDPHTHYIAIKIMSHPTPQQISNCKNMYGLDRSGYTNYLMEKENYYNILIYIIDMAMKLEGKTLIYIGTNDAIEKTKQWIFLNFPELSNDIGVYTSLIKENKEEQLNKKIILSTTKSCGAAMDIKGLNMTVVLAEPFKSEVLARQTLGRTRDDNTFYIEVVDISFASISKYYYSKKNIFGKYALSCQELTLSDKELNDIVAKILLDRKQRVYINPIRFVDNSILLNPIRFVDDNTQLRPAIVIHQKI